jgi:type IV pilus assembly protein PilM
MVDWKKEIKLSDLVRRGSSEPAESVPEPAKETSVWKKEISFRRKPKQEVAEPVAAPSPVPVPAPAPVQQAPPAPAPVAPAPPMPVPVALAQPMGPTPAPAPEVPKPSGLRREISFRRTPKAEQPQPRKAKSKSSQRLVGVKVGASQIAAARVVNNGAAELVQVARHPLEPGIVVGGELREPEALTEALKEFFRVNKLPRRGIRLGIANNRIGVRTLEIAGIDDPKQLANAIRFRAQEALPIPIEEAVLDWQELGAEVDDEGMNVRRVLLVVAYRDLVDRYVSAFKKAGLTLSGIDLEAFALLRSLAASDGAVGADADAALVAVTIGHDRSTFAVSDGRVCEFTRVLDWGGSALNVAIARALELSPTDAEPVKRALSLLDNTLPAGLTVEQSEAAREAVRRQIQTFARELVSSLQFYQNQSGSLGIGEIVVTGGTAHLLGLADELEKLIGVRVRVGDPLGRVKVSRRLGDPEQVGSFAVAIGLGIDD